MARSLFEELITEENLIRIQGWARDGLTNEQIAKNLDIAPKTLWEWQTRDNELSRSLRNTLKKSKEIADREVENALYKRAIGYDTIEETTEERLTSEGKMIVISRKKIKKHIPPDTTAQIYWLNNRKPDKWRNKQEITTFNADRITENMTALAEQLKQPVKDRKIKDFE